jgi:hypothetical protein
MSTSAPPPDDPPLHLTAADFDAYLPERAASNSFTRPRLELKQRMLAWARGVVDRLDEMGIAVEKTGSDEHPNVRNGRRVECQRVFFWRDADARAELERLIDQKRTLAASLGDPAPHKNHAYLALRLDSERVEVSIEVHAEAWVDTRNLRARLADPGRALELTAALEALPEQFSIGLAVDAERAQAQRATNDEVRALLDRVDAEKAPLWIGWSVPRDVVLTHTDLLDEQLEDAIVALGPLFKLVAWAPDNDLVVLNREWDAARNERARAHEEAERDRAEWEARREGERRTRAPRDDERAWRGARKASAPPSVDRDSEQTPPPPAVASGASDASQNPAAPPLRPIARRAARVTEVDPSATVEKGARVQVLGGPFEGKVGVVQELDGKGGARVMLGLLAMRFEVKDLIVSAEGRDRPLLSSSHRRRPIPARS